MPEWKLSSLQVVWFISPTSAADFRLESAYFSLVGAYPQNTQRNQIPGAAPDAVISVAAGQDSIKSYQLNAQPGRIDLVVTAAAPLLTPRTPPLLDNPEFVIDELLSRISQIDLSTVTVSRIALIGNFWNLAKNLDQAVLDAVSCIGLGPDWIGASDFNFQINKRKDFDNRTTFNRLMSWSTPVVRLVEFSPAINMSSAGPASHLSEFYPAALSVDVNTVADDTRVFSQDDQFKVFEGLKLELIRLWRANSPTALIIS